MMERSDLADVCLRCAYDLRGIGDDQPCPECGLLAGRSRERSGHLQGESPRWLLGIAIGIDLMLLANLTAIGWPIIQVVVLALLDSDDLDLFDSVMVAGVPISFGILFLLGYSIAALLLWVGIWMLTRRPIAQIGSTDAPLRWSSRLAATIPILALGWLHYTWEYGDVFGENADLLITLFLFTIGCAPLPTLVFIYLRRLARRVLNLRLAEHAAIVGIGTSLTLLYVPAMFGLLHLGGRFGGENWIGRSDVALILQLLAVVFLILFAGWSLLTCIRFAIAFHRAYRTGRQTWTASDRSAD